MEGVTKELVVWGLIMQNPIGDMLREKLTEGRKIKTPSECEKCPLNDN